MSSKLQVALTKGRHAISPYSSSLLGVARGLLAGVAGKGVAVAVGLLAGGRRDLLLLKLTFPFAAESGGCCLCTPLAAPSGFLPTTGVDPVATGLDTDWR